MANENPQQTRSRSHHGKTTVTNETTGGSISNIKNLDAFHTRIVGWEEQYGPLCVELGRNTSRLVFNGSANPLSQWGGRISCYDQNGIELVVSTIASEFDDMINGLLTKATMMFKIYGQNLTGQATGTTARRAAA
jgi:hypothetical protein